VNFTATKALLILWGLAMVAGAEENYVTTEASGKLAYWHDAQGNRIPDFSNCGYRGGGVTLPIVEIKGTVEPAEGDCTGRIQAVIDQVSQLPKNESGWRGAVLLKSGTYHLNNPIAITADGVVLRGEGQGENGTVLIATKRQQHTLIKVGGVADTSAADDEEAQSKTSWKEVTGSRRKIIDHYVPVGTRHLRVEDAASFKVGEQVIIWRPSTENWIHVLGMDQIPQRSDGTVTQWTAGSKDLRFDRVVTAVDKDSIEVDAPICNAIETQYGGGFVYRYEMPARISEVGVENLRGVSEYKGETDEKHGWILISLGSVVNAWVRDVTSVHFGYSCVHVEKSAKWVTVQDSSCLDPISRIKGGRRYSFLVAGQLTLVQRCYAREGRHDFVLGATAPGPNVFLDCTADNAHADSGPHQRWSVGMLFDTVRITGMDAGLNIRNRGNSGTGHGWTGANSVIWNCSAPAINCQNPPTAQNWAIGSTADKHPTGDGNWESFGQPVKPESLYLAQLAERLGPQAVVNMSKDAHP